LIACCRVSRELVLLEVTESFFAYRPILQALQANHKADLPFAGLLTHSKTAWVRHQYMFMSNMMPVLNTNLSSTSFKMIPLRVEDLMYYSEGSV
jgi:hypothetical protein